ncbi:MAG: hypothetical protein AB8G15_06740 [Saprospiraceae bacterium]
MMNKLILICAALCLFLAPTLAQGDNLDNVSEELNEKIESQRIAFLTNRLQLTPEEAKGFWPLYNQYKSAEKALRKKHKPPKRVENMTDEEIEKHILAGLDAEEEKVALKRRFFFQLKAVLSIRKIGRIQLAEKAFKRKMLRAIKGKRKRNKEK